MASKKELEALIVLAGKVDPSLQKALKSAEQSTKRLSKEKNLFGKAASNAWGKVKTGVAIGAAALGAAMVYAGKKGLDLASDLTEVQNVVDVTFGENSHLIDVWAKTALKSFGLSELSAKQYSSTLGALMKSSGVADTHLVTMSENLTGLAGDFASFYNLKPEEAFDKIKSGIAGQTEPLKALGIDMSVTSLSAYALSKGITTAYDKMGQADKVLLRHNYLLEKSADAQTDFARTQDTYANQQRLFQEGYKQLSGTVMKAAIPAFTKLYQKGNELIDQFAGSPEKVEKLQDVIGKVFDKVIDKIPAVISGTGKFLSVIWRIFTAGYRVFTFIQRNWGWIAPLILGIVSAMAAWHAITKGMMIYKGVMAGIRAGTIAATIAQWGLNAAVLANPMTWIVVGIAAAIGVLVAGFYLLWKHWDKVSAFLSKSWTNIKHAFAVGINAIVDGLNWLIKKMNKIPGVEIPLIPKMDTSAYDAAAKSQNVNVPKFARGGFANRPSIFGEAGPEAAIPLKRTPRSLGLLSRTAEALGVGGGKPNKGDGPTFVYSPTYGSEVSESRVRKDYEDFKAMMEEWWEARRREEYA